MSRFPYESPRLTPVAFEASDIIMVSNESGEMPGNPFAGGTIELPPVSGKDL